MNNIDERYMRRALELAAMGEIGAHPNPMVGAVIVAPDGTIIGEGYHRICGQAHAEVNAINNVQLTMDNGQLTMERQNYQLPTAHCPLPTENCQLSTVNCQLKASTLYVTLEPCSHYGKTPPCAKLIIEKGIPRVVVGMVDPFAKVQGRGIKMLRDAGVEVTVLDGPVADACRALNRRFITAHTLRRPYVALKWAQTADGYVDGLRSHLDAPLRISTPATRQAVHRYRSTFDAIAVGSGTERMDRPSLDARLWPGGRAPQRVYFRRGDLLTQLHDLYDRGITSLLIEGGPTLQQSFIDANLYDEARIERSPLILGAAGVAAPSIPLDSRLTFVLTGAAGIGGAGL